MNNKAPNKESGSMDSCPHCGYRLSPWQQVLLSVDREIMCKNCWYRIYLHNDEETPEEGGNDEKDNKTGSQE